MKRLPLKDLFRNQKIEFDYGPDDVKFLYASLKPQERNNLGDFQPGLAQQARQPIKDC